GVPGAGQGKGGQPRLRRQRGHRQREAEPGGAAGPAAKGSPRVPADHPAARGRGPPVHRRGRRGGGGEGDRMIERMKELRRRRKRKDKRRKMRLREARAAAAKKPAPKR